jgi:hypothetical protein
MLTWEILKAVAEADGYTYTITRGEEPDNWEVDLTLPDGTPEYGGPFRTLDEAKDYCELTASGLAGEGTAW